MGRYLRPAVTADIGAALGMEVEPGDSQLAERVASAVGG